MFKIKSLNGSEKEFDTLSGADLSGIDFRGADLSEADLSGADLRTDSMDFTLKILNLLAEIRKMP